MGKLAKYLQVGVRGAIRIELERDALHPGELLVGTVFLNVTRPIQYATLRVHLRGRQTLEWVVPHGKHRVHKASAHDHFVEEATVKVGGKISELGEKRYPFSFQLPVDLPHSVSYSCPEVKEFQDVHSTINYTVEASLDVRAIRTSNLDASLPFTIEPLPVPVPSGNPITLVHSEQIKLFSEKRRGFCVLHVDVDHDVFDATSVIETQVDLRLDEGHGLKHVVLAVYEDVTVNSHSPLHHSKRATRAVCRQRFDHAVTGLSPTSSGKRQIKLQLPISPNDLYEFEPLIPTMTSHYVDISYRVAVECHFALSRRVRADAPVTIVRKPDAQPPDSPAANAG